MFAVRQVDLMAHSTDVASVPKGHDQITVSFFSISVSAPPPGAHVGREGGGGQLSAG